MKPLAIDLSCDLGEDPEALRSGRDRALLDLVTSANVACGGHAGDVSTMEEIVRLAAARGVRIGAHPGYPDRERFGRVEIPMSDSEIEDLVASQAEALGTIARRAGVRLTHLKPHGALYHASMSRREVAVAVARGAARFDSGLVLVGLAGATALGVWHALGFHVAAEAFADRRYEEDGSLRSRTLPGALIDDPGAAARQASRIATGAGVVTVNGSAVGVRADTLCVHGDTPGAVSIARAVRHALEAPAGDQSGQT